MDSVRALGYPTLQPDHVPWVSEMLNISLLDA